MPTSQYNQSEIDALLAKEADKTTVDALAAALSTDISNLNKRVTALEAHVPPPTSGIIPQGIIVPSYIYPGGTTGRAAWQKIFDNKKRKPKVPVVVKLNPGSGHTLGKIVDFQWACDEALKAGCEVGGYVAVGYGNNILSTVKAEIENYRKSYGTGMTWLFLDEYPTGSNPGKGAYLKEITDYARAQGYKRIKGNPGTATLEEYLQYVDCVEIAEGSSLPSDAELYRRTFQGRYPDSKFYVNIYAQPTFNQATLDAGLKYAGWIYMTHDVLSNPYDTLTVYFDKLIDAIDAFNIKIGAYV